MNSNDEVDLSLDAVAILTALTSSMVTTAPAPEEAEPLLTKFVCGFVTEEERLKVLDALTESHDLRIRLLELRDQMKLLSQGLSEQEQVFEQNPDLADTLRTALAVMVGAYSKWKLACQTAFSGERSSGSEGILVQLALRRFGESLRSQPLAFSTTRGEETGGRLTIEPGSTIAEITAMVQEDGRLQVTATMNPPLETSTEVSVYAVANDGAWAYLGCSKGNSNRLTLSVEQFAGRLGTTAGNLKSTVFALTEGKALPIGQTIQLKGNDGFPDVWLAVTRLPTISGGTFSIGLDFPESIRLGLTDGVIAASIKLGSIPFHVAKWSVDSLPASPEAILSAPLPGIGDCQFELLSAVSLSYGKK